MTTESTISLSNGGVVYIRGKLTDKNTSTDYSQFTMSGSIEAQGDIRFLWDYENLDAPLYDYCGYKLFYDCRSLESAPILPATTLSKGCYSYMFQSCSSLASAPELPATTLEKECYKDMFNGCTKLKSTPVLPAATLAPLCYNSMFWDVPL